MFRIAKVFREWDVDKLEEEMPPCMIVEWNEYINYEISQWTEAILGAIPTAKSIESSAAPIKDPELIGAIFDKLGARKSNG